MSDLIHSAVTVQNSITNPDVSLDRALDNNSPFTFFEFLKQTSASYTPEEYSTFYTQYLSNWSIAKNSKVATTDFISNQYIELLRDISLNYTTNAEKRFLTTVDFEDPANLDTIIPFYTKKIREIVIFYKQKRDTGSFVIERNKIKGTDRSIEKAIYELITQYVFSDDSSSQFSAFTYNINLLRQNLEIDVHEFVDIYSNYFDLSRDSSDETGLRAEEFSFQTVDIDKNAFFNVSEEVYKDIFGSQVFLKEIPIAVNVQLNYNPICAPTNPLGLIVKNDSEDQLGADARLGLKRRLYEKYLGTDFYYLSTNSFIDSTSGVFITADNPSGNLLNRQTADIAATPADTIQKLRDIGLFFKPDKQGALKINAKRFTYDIDTSKLLPNTVYIFPDPSVYGNVSLNPQTDYPLVYTYDATPEVKNISHGIAVGDPRLDFNEQQFLPYYSRQQNRIHDDNSIFINFSDLYNQGLLVKWQTDIYGNEYGMFKDSFGQYFIDQIDQSSQFVTCLTLDGHVFFDSEEGYNFDYSIFEQVDATTLRSGVTSRTVNNNSSPSFYLSGAPLWFNFKQFTPYQFCSFANGDQGSNDKFVTLYDAGDLMRPDNTYLPDPIYADSSSYPNGYYYYDVLVEGGVGSNNPIQRAVTDNPTLSGNLFYDLRQYLSAGAIVVDGGLLTDNLIISSSTNELYIDDVDPGSTTVLLDLSATNAYTSSTTYATLTGKSFTKQVGATNSLPLSTSLQPIITKYNTNVQYYLNNHLIDFDIVYDTVVLESAYALVFDKLEYNGTSYDKPATKNTFYTVNTASNFNKISNRWFNEKDNNIVFCILSEYPVLSASNFKIVYPNIYKYDIATNKVEKMWPRNPSCEIPAMSAMFAIPLTTHLSLSFGIAGITKPQLTHNNLNNVYKLTYVGKDLNNYPHLFDIQFKERNTFVEIMSSKLYTQVDKYVTTTIYAMPSSQYITFGFRNNLTPTSNGIV